MYRLSGFDACLLPLETPSQPLTTCALLELDASTMSGGYSFARFRERLSGRLAALPEFHMKLADSVLNLATPVWVEDRDFDLDRHLHRIELPAPRTRRELSQLAGRLLAERLDRSRPLWDMWVIEGLSGADPHFSGCVAVMLRMHHVLGDGVTGLDIVSRLLSTEAEPPPPEVIDGVGTVGKWKIVLDGLVRFAGRPWFLVTNVLPATVAALVKTIRRSARGQAMSGIFSAPRTPFSGNLTEHRTIAYVQLDLEDVNTIKDQFGVKLNDVMLALVSGALRQLLLDRAALPRAALVAAMPISVFEANRASRNQLSGMLSSLYTDLADPADRLRAIAEASSVAKDHSFAIGATLLQDWMQCAPGLLTLGMRLYRWSGLSARRPVYNLTVSTVRGPQQSYLLGAPVKANYAFGPLFHGAGLLIVGMSHNGHLDVGLVSCSDLLPDLCEVADGLPLALKELRELTQPNAVGPQTFGLGGKS